MNSKPFFCKDTIRVCGSSLHCPPLLLPRLLLLQNRGGVEKRRNSVVRVIYLSLARRGSAVGSEGTKFAKIYLISTLHMEDQYGMGDLRQYMSSRPLFPPESLSSHPYDMLIFRSDSGNNTAGGGACYSGFESSGRWPRQETLTLLEIRSRLDPKFKEANQKGPLWDQVSRYVSIFTLT